MATLRAHVTVLVTETDVIFAMPVVMVILPVRAIVSVILIVLVVVMRLVIYSPVRATHAIVIVSAMGIQLAPVIIRVLRTQPVHVIRVVMVMGAILVMQPVTGMWRVHATLSAIVIKGELCKF